MRTDLALGGWPDVSDPQFVPPTGSEAWIPFADTRLAQIEAQATQQAQNHWATWLLWLWPWMVAALARPWTTRQAQTWEDLLRQMPSNQADGMQALRAAKQAGMQSVPAADRRAQIVPPRMSSPVPRGSSMPSGHLPKRETHHAGPGPVDLGMQTAQAAWQKWEDEARDSLRWEFLWAQQQQLGIPALGARVQALWARLGVDWERLIVTELSLAYHRGLLAAVKPGTRGYIPPIGDAKVCRACHRLLEGRWFRLYPQVPPNLTAEDWQTALWPTKSNVGRKAADWIPCVPLHPHCRHLVILGPGERLARKKGSTHG